MALWRLKLDCSERYVDDLRQPIYWTPSHLYTCFLQSLDHCNCRFPGRSNGDANNDRVHVCRARSRNFGLESELHNSARTVERCGSLGLFAPCQLQSSCKALPLMQLFYAEMIDSGENKQAVIGSSQTCRGSMQIIVKPKGLFPCCARARIHRVARFARASMFPHSDGPHKHKTWGV